MRIGEVLCAKRRDLILPTDAAPGTSFLLIVIQQPKTRGRAARHQAARVDQEDIIRFISAVYKDAPPDFPLWPMSAATLRKRFASLLHALGLPSTKGGHARPFDLGSLRPGGATFLLHQTENPEYVLRRGRWISARVMEIYLQEVMVVTFLEKVNPRTRSLIEMCSSGFSATVERAIAFLDTGIPPSTWYRLLKLAADVPPENVEKVGKSGGTDQVGQPFSGSNHDDNSLHRSKKTERDLLENKKSTRGFRDSSLPPRPARAAV